jgi:hypothetical protein
MRTSWWGSAVGLAVGSLLVATVGWAEQSPVGRQAPSGLRRVSQQPPVADSVVFDVRPTPDGGTLLSAEAPGVRLEKTLYADKVIIALNSEVEQLVIRMDESQTLSVTRNGQTKTLSVAAVTRADLQAIRTLLAGSEVVEAFRALVGVLEDGDQTAAGESTLVTGAMVALLDGDFEAPRRLVRRILQKYGVRVRNAAFQGPGNCWNDYVAAALRLGDQTESCSNDHPYNPAWQAACGAQFVYRAEVNWTRFLACTGGVWGGQ